MPVTIGITIDIRIQNDLIYLPLVMPEIPQPDESSGIPGPSLSSLKVSSALAVIATELGHLRRSHDDMDGKIEKLSGKLDTEVKDLEESEAKDSAFRSEVKGALKAMDGFGRVATVIFTLLQAGVLGWVASINASVTGHGERLTHIEDRASDIKDLKTDLATNAKDVAKILASMDQLGTHVTSDESQTANHFIAEESEISKLDASLQACTKTMGVMSDSLGVFGRSVDALKPIVQQLQIDDDARQTKVNRR